MTSSNEKILPFDKAAKLDAPERRLRQPPEPIVRLVGQSLPKVLLDIGAGTGYFSIPISQHLPRTRVIAMDVEPRMLEIIKSKAEGLGILDRFELLQSPVDTIPLADGSVNSVVLVNTAHELADRKSYFREITRVLSPDGELTLCDWSPSGSKEAGPPAEYRVSAEVIEEELKAAGFSEVEPINFYTDYYTFIALK